jgi:hypothetical protein
MAMPLDKVKTILHLTKEPASLETPIGDDGENTLADFITDNRSTDPEGMTIYLNLRQKTHMILKDLSPREEKILRMRLGSARKRSLRWTKRDNFLASPEKEFAKSRPSPCANSADRRVILRSRAVDIERSRSRGSQPPWIMALYFSGVDPFLASYAPWWQAFASVGRKASRWCHR